MIAQMADPSDKSHDLLDFLQQTSNEMASEYTRIQKRATEDPGTAGDQGEENWAHVLREWLPQSYHVVTKGRIISQQGKTSPQIDVVILRGTYPRALLNKKLYLAAGVAAAFECKVTLKASHVKEAVENCTNIKSLYPSQLGTPYQELHSPIVYGLLAHSHSWKNEGSTPENNIESKLREEDLRNVKHPREHLDLLCVADLGTWSSTRVTFASPKFIKEWAVFEPKYGADGAASSGFIGNTAVVSNQVDQFSPIGAFLFYLSRKLAWRDPELRNLAEYFGNVNIAGSGQGDSRIWPTTIYSDQIRGRVEACSLSGSDWDEWGVQFL